MNRWPRKRLRFLLNKAIPAASRKLMEEADDVTFLPMEAIGEQGELDTSRVIKFDDASAGYTLFFDGDVVVAKITPCFENGKGALIEATATGLGLGTTELYVLRPGSSLNGKYLYYITADPAFRILGETQMTGAAGQKRVPEDFVRDYIVAVPAVSEQTRISRYLDTEVGVIDTLISTKTAWLDLLAEKRRAIVAEAIMRGLNPAAPLRPSGTDWLGDIPAHWEGCHLKRVLAHLDYGTSDATDVVGSIAVLRMGDIRDGELDFSKLAYLDQVEDGLLLQKGDLVFNRTNSLDQIGKVALFRGNVDFPVSFASYLVRLRCEKTVLPEYLNWVLNSSYALAWARAEALPSIGQANLNPNRYAYLPIALPPLEEQQKITKYLAGSVARLDGIRAATEHSITLLKERRGALIAAAVTGQIEIPEAA